MSVLWPFIAIAMLALLEFLLARTWARAYFTIGLPIFRMRLEGIRLGADAEQRLATVADRNSSLIVYQRLSESEIAFREKGRAAATFRYIPLFRGLLRYAPEEGATYIIGWMNYFALAFVGFWVYLYVTAPRYRKPTEPMVWFALVLGVMYFIGAWRYRMVAKALRATSAAAAPQSSPAQ